MTRAMPLDEHLGRANHAWTHMRENGPKIPTALRDEMRAELRKDAIKFAPLYPLIEARRGLPF